MSNVRRIRPAEYRVMPWKNGLGTTTEIAVHPPGAALDAFDWRLSIADLTASGPFSTFAGYDRILVQIEGAPMTLRHEEGRGERRLRLLHPYRFVGELGTYGELEAPARDFNVMVRRERASAEVSVHELAPALPIHAEGEADVGIIYVLGGEVSVEVDGDPVTLIAQETLLATSVRRFAVMADQPGAAVILVAIETKGRFAVPPST